MGGFFSGLFDVLVTGGLYGEAIRFAVFLAFCALGELVAERAGTLNISVEGMALLGAFYAAVIGEAAGSTLVGLLTGVLAGVFIAALQANLSHRLTANQFGVGLTLNLLVVGYTAYLMKKTSIGTERATTVLSLDELPGVFGDVLGQRWTAYLIAPCIALTWWLLYRTRWGLEIRSVGENPQAADVSGIHVNRRRRQSIYYCGAMCGLAGAFLSLNTTGFTRNMTSGKSIIAIAAVIFGGWTVRGVLGGCLLFGFAESVSFAVQAKGYDVNLNLLNSLPFAVTLVVMAAFARRTRAPKALAQPFVRGIT